MTGLERLRLDALMTVDDLAKAAKIDPKTIRRIEDREPVHVRSLAKLSSYFGVSASVLVRSAPEPQATDLEPAA